MFESVCVLVRPEKKKKNRPPDPDVLIHHDTPLNSGVLTLRHTRCSRIPCPLVVRDTVEVSRTRCCTSVIHGLTCLRYSIQNPISYFFVSSNTSFQRTT